MLTLLLLASILVVDGPPNNNDTHEEYQAVQRASGRAPADQVRLAYWCEAHGLTTERMRHLALAVLADPTNAAARGLLGLVQRDGRWLRPEVVTDQRESDPKLVALLAEYDGKRSTTPYTADAQFVLGAWAEDQGLKEQAKAHFTAATRIDPGKETAWKRLGYTKHDGRWATDAQLAAEKADADAQKTADRKWKPLLEKWKAQLDRPSQQAEAEANLLTVTDSRAVASVGKVFGSSDSDGPRLVQLLGQIDAPSSSRALAYLAAFSPSPDVRRTATETLRGRDPREYANLLIASINKPIHYEVKPVNGPGSPGVLFIKGNKANLKRLYEPKTPVLPTDQISMDRFGRPVVRRVLSFAARSRGGRPFAPDDLRGFGTAYSDSYGSESSLFGNLSYSSLMRPSKPEASVLPPGAAQLIHEFQSNVTRNSSQQSPAAQAGAKIGMANFETSVRALTQTQANFDPRDVAGEESVEYSVAQIQAEINRSAVASEWQMANDVAQLDRQNQAINEANDRLVGILNSATGENLPADRTSWERWWVDMLGYAFVAGQTETNPTFVEVIPSGYEPQVSPSNFITRQIFVNGISCFGAGTLVQTMSGPRAIETLKVGDMVLTQSTTTGGLGYQPILVTHHNPPSGTFRIKVGGDEVVASAFHRFWVARRGWVMARDLKAGDPVRTLGGVLPVESVEAGKVELVYNLDVAEDADFFAGSVAALVHDNTLPDPRLAPFDKPAEVAAK